MLIGGDYGLFGIQGYLQIRPPYTIAQVGGAQTNRLVESRQQLTHLRRLLVRLRKGLQEIDKPFRSTRVTGYSQVAGTASAAPLGLAGAAAATLHSTAEINATPTSFSPFGPDWSGTSTALVTLDGDYDGSLGDTSLLFEVLQGGTHGQQNLRLKVTDLGGGTVEQIDIGRNDPIATQYQMSNGLIFTLGEGDLVRRDTLTVDVSSTVGSTVDPDKPFDGVRNDRPNFEAGVGVTAGSFNLNGTIISVLASDTINSVLDRINQAGTGVLASFDTATEAIRLVHQTPGAAGVITLADDTSGFLTATKLSGAVMLPGQDADTDRPLRDVQRFATVLSGSITINGIGIGIDPGVDTLNAVLASINESGAGVLARLDETGQRVTITASEHDRVMVLDDGGTGFLAALEISAGTYEPREGAGRYGGGLSTRHANAMADLVDLMSEVLNEIFGAPHYGDQIGSLQEQLRTSLREAIAGAFDSDGRRLRTKFGVSFDWQAPAGHVLKFSAANRNRLISQLKRSPDAVNELFYGSTASAKDGLVDRLLTATDAAITSLDMRLGGTGLLVDTLA